MSSSSISETTVEREFYFSTLPSEVLELSPIEPSEVQHPYVSNQEWHEDGICSWTRADVHAQFEGWRLGPAFSEHSAWVCRGHLNPRKAGAITRSDNASV